MVFGRWLCKSPRRGQKRRLVAIVKDYQELLAAISSDEIVRPHGGKQPLGCLAQDFITSDVAVGIDHAFEVIQIAHQDGCGDMFAPGTGKFAAQQIHNHSENAKLRDSSDLIVSLRVPIGFRFLR